MIKFTKKRRGQSHKIKPTEWDIFLPNYIERALWLCYPCHIAYERLESVIRGRGDSYLCPDCQAHLAEIDGDIFDRDYKVIE